MRSTELKTTDNLMPFMDVNPYKEPLSKAEQYVLMLAQPKGEMDTSLTADEILTMIRDLNHDYLDLKAREDRLKKQKEELLEKLHELEPFQPLDVKFKRSLWLSIYESQIRTSKRRVLSET